MCAKWFMAFSIGAVLASSGLLAQENFNAGTVGGANAARRSDPSSANRWRYKFHNGRWWYYDRNKQWSYWNGNSWTAYERRPSVQPFNSQRYDFGRRPPGTIQRQKNNPRAVD